MMRYGITLVKTAYVEVEAEDQESAEEEALQGQSIVDQQDAVISNCDELEPIEGDGE